MIKNTNNINNFLFSELLYRQLSNGFHTHNYDRDLQLVIIDKKNSQRLSKVKKEIKKSFNIVDSVNIVWSDSKHLENSYRLFDNKLILKEFIIIIFEDKKPSYHLTNNGHENKNITFIKSNTIKLKISHITNELSDFMRLATLIFGKHELLNIINGKKVNDVSMDIVGSNGWVDFKQFIEIANMTTNWLVLRNFEYLPYDFFENDKDVDMLCSDINLFTKTMNLTKWSWGIAAYQTSVAGKNIPFDVRYIGDDYYDKLWEYDMLKNKQFTKDNVPRMNNINYFFSLIYHSKIQKTNIKSIYVSRILQLSEKINFTHYEKNLIYQDKEIATVINNFLLLNNYTYVKPLDISVPENEFILRYLDKEIKNEITIPLPLTIRIKKYVPNFILKLIPPKIKKLTKELVTCF